MADFLSKIDTGTVVISHSISMPRYDIGDIIVFKHEDEELFDTIIGYRVDAMQLKGEIGCQIAYDLECGESILEDEVCGVFTESVEELNVIPTE